MTTVSLRYFAAVREAAGVEKEERKASSVAAALEEACAEYGAEFARLISISSLLLNGAALPTETAKAQLDADAKVDVLPPFAGG